MFFGLPLGIDIKSQKFKKWWEFLIVTGVSFKKSTYKKCSPLGTTVKKFLHRNLIIFHTRRYCYKFNCIVKGIIVMNLAILFGNYCYKFNHIFMEYIGESYRHREFKYCYKFHNILH